MIIQAGIGAGVGEWYAAATQAKDDRLQCCLGPKGQSQRQQTQPGRWQVDQGVGFRAEAALFPRKVRSYGILSPQSRVQW